MTKNKQRMRLTVHSALDGSIHGVVIQPEGKVTAHLVPAPGIEVAEIPDHKFHGEVDHEKVLQLGDRYKVKVTPATGELKGRRTKSSKRKTK